MRVLVTGASGFTGGYMVDNLLEHGHQVRAFVRPDSDVSRLKGRGVDIYSGDLRYKADLAEAMRNMDVVYHIAALYRAANQPDQAYWDVNVTGTENVLAAAIEMGVKRVLHCSTCGVHGHIEKPPADENAPLVPGDIYQETKLEGEKVAMYYHRERGLPVTICRPVGIYGPGDTRMLKMYRMIYQGKFIMFGSGNVLYHLSYVTDIVEGFRLAAESPRAAGETYIIAGDGWFTLNDFAATVAEALRVPAPRRHFPVWPVYAAGWLCEKICVPLRVQPPIFRRRVDLFVKDRAFDISKAKQELGFRPQVGTTEGIRRTAQWYLEKGMLG